nr:N-acetyltransferase [Cupriavidus basilensis]
MQPSLANFVRLAMANGHALLYHPATVEDINQDKNVTRRQQTLQRLHQYSKLDVRMACPWNNGGTSRNDAVDNEILYALAQHAAHALITEDRGIHGKATARGLANRVYTIQTAEDLLLRLHERVSVQLPNIEDVPLYTLVEHLPDSFFESLRDGYGSQFDEWFKEKAADGRRAWVHWKAPHEIGGICIYTRQDNEAISSDFRIMGTALKLSTFKVGEGSRGRKVGELFLKAAFRYATANNLEHIFIHGDLDRHHFLFEMLTDFGFINVGTDPGSNNRDVVYLKYHPSSPPCDEIPPFEYLRKYFPHYKNTPKIGKYIVPIRPGYHEILFPDYESLTQSQKRLFEAENCAGNAIKMAYLCHAKTTAINAGDIIFFYRSIDTQAITSIGIAESYETINDADAVIAKVKRRTVYTLSEIASMTEKPTRVLLFRFVRHLSRPIAIAELIANNVLNGHPQSITKLSHDKFQRITALGE